MRKILSTLTTIQKQTTTIIKNIYIIKKENQKNRIYSVLGVVVAQSLASSVAGDSAVGSLPSFSAGSESFACFLDLLSLIS